MMYNTAFDEITQTRPLTGTGGLAGLSSVGYQGTDPSTGLPAEINLACGLDQNGNPWIQMDNTYYYDLPTLQTFLNSGPTPTIANRIMDNAMLLAPGLYGQFFTMADLVGLLQSRFSVPFTVYVPPPAPTPPPSPTAPPTLYPLPSPTPPPAPPVVPNGFSILYETGGVPRAWPVYSAAPVATANGQFDFSGATPFVGYDVPLVPSQTMQTLGLNTTKLDAGLYAYTEVDAGPIVLTNGRTYELWVLTIFDTSTQTVVGTYFETVEGGGGGLLINAIAPDILSFVSTVATGGINQIVSAINQKAGRIVNDVVGGAVIAGTAAVITAGAIVPVVAPVIAAGAGAEGAVIGATDQENAAGIVEGSMEAGVITGVVGGTIQAATTPDPVSDAVNGASSTPAPSTPQPYTPGQAPSAPSDVLSGDQTGTFTTTPDNAVAATPPTTPTTPGTTPIGTGAGATPATAPVTSPSTAPGLVQATGTALKTGAQATIVSTTLAALTTEIKKISGQLPKAAQPPLVSASPTATPATAQAASSTSGLLLAGIAGAAVLLGKKS